MQPLSAQKHDYNWVFSDRPIINMSFATPTPSIEALVDSTAWYNFVWGGSSMSDKEGNLLFFTNGYKVFDRTGKVMPNGIGLNENSYTQEWQGLNPLLQGAMIIPHPDSEGVY
ncbi:MAG: hypothetical protein JNK66_08045, partial [Chitinophagales bacterium]|nr:hypothetical protein [Chitinophagales bacterium]